VLQVQAGQTIQVRYADSLDATGSSVERSTDVVAGGGCDARLAATAVLQPGDTLRVLLADPDLGQGPLSQDSATVTVANRRTSEREVLVLRGLAAGDSVFVGQLPTTPQDGPSGDGLLGTRRADTLEVTYLDSEAASGQPVERHCATFVVDPLGDVDANGLVQAFDASRVLTHVLTPCLAGYDSLAANLDSLAPYGPITPTDAVLILQQRVGLRQRFPVQASGSLNVPQWNATVAAPRLVTVTRPASLAWEGGELVVRLADRSGIVAGQLDLEGIEGSVAMGQGMPAFVVVWDARGGRTRVALAGPTPVAATGTLVRLRATRIVGDIRLARAEFNDGRIAADPVDCPGGPIPLCFGLLPNYPNPMNPTTCIPFQVPEPIRVELSILNLAGQLVRTLVSQVVPAGTHVVSWNATDQADRSVGSGVYLCRMRAGSFGQTRRMVVLH
jgi:hypothetical protein